MKHKLWKNAVLPYLVVLSTRTWGVLYLTHAAQLMISPYVLRNVRVNLLVATYRRTY